MKNLLEKIENNLPNGFHDSDLYELRINYVKREIEFILGVDVSNAEMGNGKIIYKRCQLLLTGLIFYSVESPDQMEMLKGEGEGIRVDSGVLEGERLSKVYPEKLPDDSFAHWFFLNDINSFIYVAAKDANFKWLE